MHRKQYTVMSSDCTNTFDCWTTEIQTGWGREITIQMSSINSNSTQVWNLQVWSHYHTDFFLKPKNIFKLGIILLSLLRNSFLFQRSFNLQTQDVIYNIIYSLFQNIISNPCLLPLRRVTTARLSGLTDSLILSQCTILDTKTL